MENWLEAQKIWAAWNAEFEKYSFKFKMFLAILTPPPQKKKRKTHLISNKKHCKSMYELFIELKFIFNGLIMFNLKNVVPFVKNWTL